MTEKDLDEFEKEFGFKLLPTSFKKPLSEITKEEYEKALNEMNDAFYGITFLRSETRRFDDNLNLLRELVNEHFEERQEKNIEHYYDKLTTIGMDGFAVTNGKIISCAYTKCSECEFNGGGCCGEKRFIWLASPYKKPTYKLTKFEKELLQCYPDIYSFKVFNSLNGMKEKGYFKGIDDNEIIGDILAKCEVIEDRKEVIKND